MVFAIFGNSCIKLLWSCGPTLGESICWGHSVLQTMALVVYCLIIVIAR